MEVKVEVAEIKRKVIELFDKLVIPEPEVMTIFPDVHVDNIWAISESVVEETLEKKRGSMRRNLLQRRLRQIAYKMSRTGG